MNRLSQWQVPSHTRVLSRAAVLLVFLALGAGLVRPAQAQGSGLAVSILSPRETEIFYSSPTTLAYSIPIKGLVTGMSGDPTRLVVQLEIFAGNQLSTTGTTHPQEDGTFSFSATVNPENSEGNFTPVEIESHCEECHYRAEIDLPRGRLLLRITARTPETQAIAERHITVDRSSFVDVPVQVIPADTPGQSPTGIPVLGTAWLYQWRARAYSATTDAQGQALVHLEALAQAPTRYTFRVARTVVNGLLYESVEPVDVTLPPGAASAPQITLRVRSRAGQITGTLDAPTETTRAPISIRAIHLPDGVGHRAQTSTQGGFAFSDLPIGKYLIVVDPDSQGLTGEPKSVDLAQSPSTSITLPVQTLDRSTLRGVFRDDTGAPVPFVWAAFDQSGATRAFMPGVDAVVIPPPASLPITISLTAPGFYSRQQTITSTAETSGALEAAFIRRPETRTLPWGSGRVIIPPETEATFENQQIDLTRGWLWGRGDAQAVVIRTPAGQISISEGTFALERVSDEVEWFYLMQGQATVSGNFDAPVTVRAGEMMALVSGATPQPVPIDPVVVAALHPSTDMPIVPTWQPTSEQVTRTQITQTGITAAQVVTFVVYLLALLSLILIPPALLVWWTRYRKKQTRS